MWTRSGWLYDLDAEPLRDATLPFPDLPGHALRIDATFMGNNFESLL